MSIENILPVIGTLIAAFVGAFIAGYLNRKGKLDIEVKSKHRQDWTNSLRNEIALILSKSHSITYDLKVMLYVNCKQNKNTDLNFSLYFKYYEDIIIASRRITLFLNPNKKEYQDLDNDIKKLEKLLIFIINENINENTNKEESESLIENIESNLNSITKKAQNIFKEEWEKIKNGK